jgi:iron complex outermembrane receptor protein
MNHSMRIPLAALLCASMSSVVADEKAQSYNIPAQPLHSALQKLADQAGVAVFFSENQVNGKTSPALIGQYNAREALQKLLAGSGLTYTFTTEDSVSIKAVDSGNDVSTLPAVKVLGKSVSDESPSLTTPSLSESQSKLNGIAGGTTVIDGERIKEGAALTVHDMLATAPGVYIGDTSAGTTAGSKISIRGSDSNSFISPIRGLKFLRNGMPYTNANGDSDTESLNLYAIDHIDVYRGANALEYGGSNLGGAINFITPTGYTADPLKIGMTWGTNGFVKPSVSAGKVFGNGFDAYGSFYYQSTDTTRENNRQEQFLGHGNIGYRWNDNQETRLYFDIQNHNFLWPATLTKQEVADNPHQNANDWSLPNGFPVYRVDLKHSVKLNNGDRFDVGAYYSNHQYRYDYTGGSNHDSWENVGVNGRHEINGKLFGLNNKVIWGGLTQMMFIGDRNYETTSDRQLGPLINAERDRWLNIEGYMEDQLSLTDSFNLIAGLQLNYRKVNYERTEGYTASASIPNSQGNQDFFNPNPKLGFTWQATKEAQIYGNLSRSSEPAPLWNLEHVFVTPKLTSQTGSTVEIGTRGQTSQLKWDMAYYQSWLNNEYLIIGDPRDPTVFNATNANGTTLHSGVELGLETTLPLSVLAASDQIRLSGNYTWNNFHFDNDQTLGNNQLPGVPEHVARIEALYQHPSGFYIGPNAQIASTNWVDFANTLSADSYALMGARIGWDDGKHWKLFIDGRNLTDEHYASSVWVMGNAGGADQWQFNPGATRSVFGGFEYRF